jgi:hypothetical protein
MSWFDALNANSCTNFTKARKGRTEDLLSLLPDVFTIKDVLKVNAKHGVYASENTARHAESMVKLGHVTKEYKKLPSGGRYCVYTKI